MKVKAPIFLEETKAYAAEECLIWPYMRCREGYARMYHHKVGFNRPVSRVICERDHGESPTPTHHAAHSCGNGHLGCVAPNHIRWATPKENSDDKYRHGTDRRGVDIANSKLNEDQVRQIRSIYAGGNITMKALSREFGVSEFAVYCVVKFRTWKHVQSLDSDITKRSSL